MNKEIYKDIRGYEGLYQVSNYGNIKHLSYWQENHRWEGHFSFYKEKILKQYESKKNPRLPYMHVILSKEAKPKLQMVHRLIAIAFIPNPLNKPHINHIDNNPKNNDIKNLEWCTPKENKLHSVKQGRAIFTGARKLTEKQVIKIRNLRKTGMFLYVIGLKFNINKQTVLDICNKKTYKNI